MFYFLFWLSLAVLSLGTILYPLLLWLVARVKSRPVEQDELYLPRISVVIPCANEEAFIARKIKNVLEEDYPADRLEVILVSAGSTDRTEVIIDLLLPHDQLRLISLPQEQNQSQAWNAGLKAASGEVVVFTDARQLLKPGSLRALVAPLADQAVGGVSGARLEFIPKGNGEGKKPRKIRLKELIRRLRYQVKTLETRIHSVTEVNEALFACRRELLQPLPSGFVLPGLAALLQLVEQGFRVVFAPKALIYDTIRLSLRQEIERYGRLFYGYLQHLLGNKTGLKGRLIWWQLLWHNWIRLSFPLMIVLLFFSNLFIDNSWFYNIILLTQLLIIGVCLLSIVFRKPLLFYLASRFNILVIQSFYAYLNRGSQAYKAGK